MCVCVCACTCVYVCCCKKNKKNEWITKSSSNDSSGTIKSEPLSSILECHQIFLVFHHVIGMPDQDAVSLYNSF